MKSGQYEGMRYGGIWIVISPSDSLAENCILLVNSANKIEDQLEEYGKKLVLTSRVTR